jgi:CheY-specific phosphatase CheX
VNLSGPALTSRAGRENWLPLLQSAVQEVFELMLACSLSVPAEPIPEEGLDMVSIVGLAGELSGILTLRCSEKTAAHMASRMLGTTVQTADAEVCDAVGEICNMIAGNFKHQIRSMEDFFELSVPTVIRSANRDPGSAAAAPTFRMTLLFEGEPLTVSLEIHECP